MYNRTIGSSGRAGLGWTPVTESGVLHSLHENQFVCDAVKQERRLGEQEDGQGPEVGALVHRCSPPTCV